MIYCGTDIIEVERIKKNMNEGFLKKVYTPKEIELGTTKGELIKYQYYAGRFAAKEAIIKALSNVCTNIEYNKIEILNNSNGRPYVSLINNSFMDTIKHFQIDVSISHIESVATAFCVIDIN